ncbi:MAG: secretin N-terminal domain-containing protein [Planctomycetota bacterium]|jgi:type II secretory pathway component GspD/PulD (secretin)
MTEADIRDPMLLQTAEDRPKVGDVVVTRVFELEHISTVTARNLLTGMKLGIGPPREIAETGTLIVTGYAYRMPRIEQLLDLVDKPGEPKQFKFRQLKYTMAQVLAPKIKTLVEQLGEISITVAQPTAVPGRPDPRRTRPPRPQRGRPPQPTPPTASAAPAAAAEPGQPTVYLDFDERTNRVLMIGFEKELGIVEDLISSLDVAQQDLRTMRLYQMEHVDAEEVRMKLEELGIISPTRAVSTSGRFRTGRPGAGRTDRTPVRTDRTGRPGTPAAAAAAAAAGTVAAGTSSEEPLVEEPQVVIVETVNSLLVNATAEQHARIATIIGYVDSIPEGRDIPYVVYPLENQDPIELAETLNKLILETTEKQEKDAKIVTHTSRTEEEIIIIPDPKTYSLIVYASKRNQSWIRALIEQLDEYRPQVLLDCTLVEIFKNDEFSLAIDWLQAFPDLTEVSGKIPSLADAVLPETRKRFIEFDASGSAFYGDEHINLLLTAVQTRNYGRVLARPKILVNDNELGAIKTEETQYIVRVESQVSAGTTGTTSTTRSSVNFESYNAGITLEIEPHISKGDQLRLKITMIRSDFRETPPATVTDPDSGEQRTIEKPPDTVTSDIQTTVTVPDNFTVILGGLEKLNQTKGGSKVPFLGDIPFIGGLFRNTSNKDTQARLYVFVKAHILRPGDQLDGDSTMEVVSRKSRTTFERHEREMQEYEDWPGIKATPMDPLQVLTSD